MPSFKITADDTDQVYWMNQLVIHRSVGSSGGIFREATHLLSPYQTRCVPVITLTLLHHRLFKLKVSTPPKVNQSKLMLVLLGLNNYLTSLTLTSTLSDNIRVISQGKVNNTPLISRHRLQGK